MSNQEISIDTIVYHSSLLHLVIGKGLDRQVTEVECLLEIECEPDRTPRHIFISELDEIQDLYDKLGEFLKTARPLPARDNWRIPQDSGNAPRPIT